MKNTLIYSILAFICINPATSYSYEPTDKDRQNLLNVYIRSADRVIGKEQLILTLKENCIKNPQFASTLNTEYTKWWERNQQYYDKANKVMTESFIKTLIGPELLKDKNYQTLLKQYSNNAVKNRYHKRFQNDIKAATNEKLIVTCKRLQSDLHSKKYDFKHEQSGAFTLFLNIDVDDPLKYTPDELLKNMRKRH